MKKFFYLILLSPFVFRAAAQTLPATYTQTNVVTGLQYPVAFDWTPDGRYIVSQKGGTTFGSCANAKLQMFSASGTFLGTFYDLTDSVNCDFERGLLGVAVDPAFATNNFIYCYYVHRYGTARRIRVMRFTEVSNVGTNPTIILDIDLVFSPTPAGNHYGGNIHFRPSQPDKLYITIGDLAYQQGNPSLNYANKLNKPFGKMLRINTNGTIPNDNPFYDDGNPATGNDDRIWSYGHRNSFDFCFNPVTDSMYASENGWNGWDEFNVIHKGGDYGWATCEGDFVYNTSTPCTGFINPVTTWGTPLPAVTGTMYYTSSVMPEFTNHILVGDNDNGIIYDLTMGNAPAYDVVTSKAAFADVVASPAGLTTLKQGADGCIYAMKGGYTTTGTIFKICPVSTAVAPVEKNNDQLGQSFPNPASASAKIEYGVSQSSDVSIVLYDVTGRAVRSVFNGNVTAGSHTAELNGLNTFAPGSYFYKMEVRRNGVIAYTATRRLTIVR